MKKKLISSILGFFIGLINGFLGAGGGMLAVPALKLLGMDTKSAHRNAVAIILPMATISAIMYVMQGKTTFGDVYVYLPGGIAGAFAGTAILKKISPKWLGVIFGCFMIYAGGRLIFK